MGGIGCRVQEAFGLRACDLGLLDRMHEGTNFVCMIFCRRRSSSFLGPFAGIPLRQR